MAENSAVAAMPAVSGKHILAYDLPVSATLAMFFISFLLFAYLAYSYCCCVGREKLLIRKERLRPLPVVPYRKQGESDSGCVICLGDFEEEEDLKVIPGCGHMFHPECIDRWIARHLSCPVCRCSNIFGENGPIRIAATATATATATAAVENDVEVGLE